VAQSKKKKAKKQKSKKSKKKKKRKEIFSEYFIYGSFIIFKTN